MINSRSKIFQNLGNHFSPKSLWPKCERLPPRSFTFSSKRFEHLVKNLPKLLSLRNLPKILYAFPKQKSSKVLLCLDSSTESQDQNSVLALAQVDCMQSRWLGRTKNKVGLKWFSRTRGLTAHFRIATLLLSKMHSFPNCLLKCCVFLTENNESSFFYIAERTFFPLKTSF